MMLLKDLRNTFRETSSRYAHILWFIAGDNQLSSFARQLIEDSSNERYLSTASIWEITIKASLGRLTVPNPPSILVRDHVWANAIDLLPVGPAHFDILHTLPFHHNDPFDRIIVSQAIAEEMVLLSKDRVFAAYDAQTRWDS